MAITPTCRRCHGELDEPGGLAFSPPTGSVVTKHHLCADCWAEFEQWLGPDRLVNVLDGIFNEAPMSWRDAAPEGTSVLTVEMLQEFMQLGSSTGVFICGVTHAHVISPTVFERGGITNCANCYMALDIEPGGRIKQDEMADSPFIEALRNPDRKMLEVLDRALKRGDRS